MSAPGRDVERVVAHVLGTRYEDIPDAAIGKLKTFLLDTIGVGIAGSSGARVAELIETARGWGPQPEATAWLTGERMSAASAAVVNAYQIHCLEFDCVHEGAVLHPMATMLAATLAWTEREAARGRRIGGRELMAALVVGLDVATMLGIVTEAPLRFFRPATAGGFGAAAAIGRLAGFDAERLRNAFGAQYSQSCGTLQPHVEGSPLLGLQVGFNARAAIFAADLAAAGFEGPRDIFTGRYGYLTLFEGGPHHMPAFLETLGRDWQVSSLSHKPYPSGRLTHGVVDGLGRLMARHGFAAPDVARVTARVPPLVTRLVGRPDMPSPPANYAKLCLAFVTGVFLAKGRVDVPDFRGAEALEDPEVHRYAALVDVVEDGNPDENALDPQTIEVRLRDGSVHAVTLPRAFGHPEAPLSREQNEEKFRRCAGYGRRPLPPGRADALIAAIDGLADSEDATALVRLTLAGETP